MESQQFDVIIIGGGGAGLRTAIACAEVDPNLRVAVVSKVFPMRSHTVAAEGGAAAVIRDEDSLEDHAYDTISGGAWLTDQDAVWAFVNEAPKEMTQLEHWGCPWSRNPDGTVATRPFGGMKIERTWFASDKTGFHMLHALFQTSMKYDNVTRFDEFYASKLLVHDGRCQGVAAIDMRTGLTKAILGGSVVMSTGGMGRVFPFTTNGAIKTGDGMALAYREGVALKDMEFVQYHPTGLPGTGILITEAARGEGGILVNKDGHRYLQDYELGTPLDYKTDPNHPVKRSMELGPRDRLSQAFMRERAKGNTIPGIHGDVVHLDIRHLGEKKIDKKLPFVRELARNYAGIDPVYQPIPIRPVVHYAMGGIHTDINTATTLPGLYAVGEAACVSINGANRLGSNSLTELLVYGARAGRSAAAWCKEHDLSNKGELLKQAEGEAARIRALMEKDGKESVSKLRAEMTSTMEDGAGVYRSEESLKTTCDKIVELRQRYADIKLDDKTNVYNTDLITALELDYMLDCASALAFSALERKESRGSHQREDYPERQDEKYMKHSMAYRRDGEPPKIEYLDVTMDPDNRWPAGERKYGADTGFKGDKNSQK